MIVIINYDEKTGYNTIIPLKILELRVTHEESNPADKHFSSL